MRVRAARRPEDRSVLYRDGSGYGTGLCSLRSPRELLRATRPFPRPRGRGRLALLAAGEFGAAGLVGLDSRGRILGYGFGRGRITALSVCPGGARAAEVATHNRGATLRIRRLRDLRTVRARRLPGDDPLGLHCADAAGRRAYTFFTNAGATDGATRARLLEVGPGGVRTVRRGPDREVAFTRFFAYMTAGRRGLVRVALASGRAERIARVPADSWGYVPSPDETALAGLTERGVVVVEPSGRRPRVRTRRMPYTEGRLEPVWLDAGRLAYIEEFGGRLRVFDRWLRPRRRLPPFWGISPVVLGGRLLDLQDSEVASMRLRDGRRRALRELPTETANLLRAVPSRPLVRMSRRRPAYLESRASACRRSQSFSPEA